MKVPKERRKKGKKGKKRRLAATASPVEAPAAAEGAAAIEAVADAVAIEAVQDAVALPAAANFISTPGNSTTPDSVLQNSLLSLYAAAAATTTSAPSANAPSAVAPMTVSAAPIPTPLSTPVSDTRQLVDSRKMSNKHCRVASEVDTYKKGPFDSTEQQTVHNCILAYLAEKGLQLDDMQVLITRSRGSAGGNYHLRNQFSGFYRDIVQASGLNRSIDALLHFVKRKYAYLTGVMRKGSPFTAQDDARLRQLYVIHSGCFARIEREMGRPDCRDRYRILLRKDKELETGVQAGLSKWASSEKNLFVDAMAPFINADTGALDESKIDWTAVADKVRSRDAHQCARYYAYNRAKALEKGSSKFWSIDMKIALLSALKQLAFSNAQNIDWKFVETHVRQTCLDENTASGTGSNLSARSCKSKWHDTLRYLLAEDKRDSWNESTNALLEEFQRQKTRQSIPSEIAAEKAQL